MPTEQLPRRPYVELSPPLDGLAAAVAEAGRRRRRRAVLAGAGASVTAVAVALVVMFVSDGAGGDAILRPAPVPPAGDVSSPAPHTAGTTAPEGVTRGAPASPGPGAHLGSPPPATAPSNGLAAPPAPRVASIAVTRTRGAYTSEPRVCRTGDELNNSSINPGRNWCADAAVNAVSGGERLSLTLCRDSTSSGSLTFGSSREVDFVVKQGSTVVWSWSRAHAGATSPHTLATPADGCWTWSLVWPGVTQSGATAAHAGYTLAATSTADELRGHAETVDFNY